VPRECRQRNFYKKRKKKKGNGGRKKRGKKGKKVGRCGETTAEGHFYPQLSALFLLCYTLQALSITRCAHSSSLISYFTSSSFIQQQRVVAGKKKGARLRLTFTFAMGWDIK
jgi:hypothetical protein